LDRYKFFQHVTAIDSFVDENYKNPIIWVEGSGRNNGSGDDESSGGSSMLYVYAGAAVLFIAVVAARILVGVACYPKHQEKQHQKAQGKECDFD
jgi:hypothetical protein